MLDRVVQLRAWARTSLGFLLGLLIGFALGVSTGAVQLGILSALVLALLATGLILFASTIPVQSRLRKRFYPPAPRPSGAYLTMKYTPGPESPRAVGTYRDLTQGRTGFFVETGFPPSAIEFTKPPSHRRIYWGDMPAYVWCRRGRIEIDIRPTGFIVTEIDTMNDEFEVNIYR